MFDLTYILDNGILVSVLKEHFELFKNVKKVITNRILLALNINPQLLYEKLNWKKFLQFKSILINVDAPI